MTQATRSCLRDLDDASAVTSGVLSRAVELRFSVMPMEFEVAESLIEEIPRARRDALLGGQENPTIEEAAALLVLWRTRGIEDRAYFSEALRMNVRKMTGASNWATPLR